MTEQSELSVSCPSPPISELFRPVRDLWVCSVISLVQNDFWTMTDNLSFKFDILVRKNKCSCLHNQFNGQFMYKSRISTQLMIFNWWLEIVKRFRNWKRVNSLDYYFKRFDESKQKHLNFFWQRIIESVIDLNSTRTIPYSLWSGMRKHTYTSILYILICLLYKLRYFDQLTSNWHY